MWHLFWYDPSKRRAERISLKTTEEAVARERFGRREKRFEVKTPLEGKARGRLISKLFNRTRTNARERRQEFMLDRIDVDRMLVAQNYRCAVTGIGFSFTTARKDPWQPSIDRINNSKGYTRRNSRLVCLVINLAMNTWGDGVIDELFERMAAAKMQQILL